MNQFAQVSEPVEADKTADIPKWVWIPAVVMVGIGCAFPYISMVIYRQNVATMGQFGDMFGVLNSLISILGFAGVLWSLHLQREQLKASLADMKDNAKASRELAAAASAQAEALARQNDITLDHIRVIKIQSHIEMLSAQLRSSDAKQDRFVNIKIASGTNSGILTVMTLNEYKDTEQEINRLVMTLSRTTDWLSESSPD